MPTVPAKLHPIPTISRANPNALRGTPPSRATIDPAALPPELRAGPWVNFRIRPKPNGKLDKLPTDPKRGGRELARTTDPATWGTLAEALANLDQPDVAGISRVLTADDDLVGLDWDHCIAEDGTIDPAILTEVHALGCYAEVSYSGRGVRGFLRGRLPVDGRKHGPREVYQARRHLTVTGRHIAGTPTIIELRQDALAAWYREHFGEAQPRRERIEPTPAAAFDDQELLARARAARNGEKFSRLYDHGALDDYGGDASAADFALADRLCFWTQDNAQVRRLMEGSALRRAKWDEPRGASTWLDQTIERARASLRETYQPERRPEAPRPNRHDAGWAASAPPIAGGGTCGQCPLAAAPTRIAELEAQLAERDSTIAALQETLTAERQRHHQLVQIHTGLVGALNNKHVKQEARSAFAVASHVQQQAAKGKADLGAPTIIYLPAVAEAVGCTDKQLSKHLDRLDQWGIAKKHTMTEVVPDQNGRIRRITRVAVEFPALARGEGLAGVMQPLARLVPLDIANGERVGWGQRRGCPDHPNARIIRRWQDVCAECGQVVDQGERVRTPAVAVEAESLDGRDFRPSAEAVSAEVTSVQADTGEELVSPARRVEEYVLKTEVTSVQDAPAPAADPAPSPAPIEHCAKCGPPSCTCPVAAALPDPPAEAPPRIIERDGDLWCTRHRRKLLHWDEQRTGQCGFCLGEAPDGSLLAETG